MRAGRRYSYKKLAKVAPLKLGLELPVQANGWTGGQLTLAGGEGPKGH
jgi:hypothetical protein